MGRSAYLASAKRVHARRMEGQTQSDLLQARSRVRILRPCADVVALELAIESRAADAEDFSGTGFVPVHLLKNALDRGLFEFFEIV